jgi:PLD-like domain
MNAISASSIIKKDNDGLYVTGYRGNRSILLAFNLDQEKAADLAGFSIHCITPKTSEGTFPTNEYCLPNFLDFENPIKSDDILKCTNKNGSDRRPFQSFHWVHFPSAGPGQYKYTIYTAYFKNKELIQHKGPKVTLEVRLDDKLSFSNFDLGFTRGYVSSQAYVDKFDNKPIHPENKTIDYDTTPYRDQYKWLGAHVRELIFDFLGECKREESTTLDMFSYDLNEPDIIRALCDIGNRVRVFQDDSKEHVTVQALEPEAKKALSTAGVEVKTGHFQGLAHDKVFILKKNGKPIKVLTGSTNFSIRGIYVQANSALVFNDSTVADLYEQAFDQAFKNEKEFSSSLIASKWHSIEVGSSNNNNSIPKIEVSFAPHKTQKDQFPFSLEKVSNAIESANSSIFYAIMAPEGGGPVMPALENLADNPNLFSLGVIDKQGQLDLFKGGKNAGTTAYAALTKNAPSPFKKEMSSLEGKFGQVIHHKYVVCDFNDKNPVVFCGSSNLAKGGEQHNGDNLIAIYDQAVATAYAVESIRLYDHYKFASLLKASDDPNTTSKTLKSSDEWIKPYYDTNDIRFTQRQLLCPINQ